MWNDIILGEDDEQGKNAFCVLSNYMSHFINFHENVSNLMRKSGKINNSADSFKYIKDQIKNDLSKTDSAENI